MVYIELQRALKNQGFWSIPNAFGVSDFKTTAYM